jgi:hypothetical protein
MSEHVGTIYFTSCDEENCPWTSPWASDQTIPAKQLERHMKRKHPK